MTGTRAGPTALSLSPPRVASVPLLAPVAPPSTFGALPIAAVAAVRITGFPGFYWTTQNVSWDPAMGEGLDEAGKSINGVRGRRGGPRCGCPSSDGGVLRRCGWDDGGGGRKSVAGIVAVAVFLAVTRPGMTAKYRSTDDAGVNTGVVVRTVAAAPFVDVARAVTVVVVEAVAGTGTTAIFKATTERGLDSGLISSRRWRPRGRDGARVCTGVDVQAAATRSFGSHGGDLLRTGSGSYGGGRRSNV